MVKKSKNKTEKKKGWEKTLWDFFSSLQLTISLMILLALVSIIGALIAQNSSPDQYLRDYSLSTYHA